MTAMKNIIVSAVLACARTESYECNCHEVCN